jgi:hypothetical protein
MNNPATAEVWQMAFRQGFGGMAQGDNKTEQKGTIAMFLMTHDGINSTCTCGEKVFHLWKPCCQLQTAEGVSTSHLDNSRDILINYKSSASKKAADLDTAKLHWNSMVSAVMAKYMYLNIQNFYLTKALEYFEYIKIPLTLFSAWILEQYNLTKHALNEYVNLEMRRAAWGLLQVGILANKCLRRKLVPFGYYESTNTPGLWCHKTRPITFTIVVNNFGIKYINKDYVNHYFKH